MFFMKHIMFVAPRNLFPLSLYKTIHLSFVMYTKLNNILSCQTFYDV